MLDTLVTRFSLSAFVEEVWVSRIWRKYIVFLVVRCVFLCLTLLGASLDPYESLRTEENSMYLVFCQIPFGD